MPPHFLSTFTFLRANILFTCFHFSYVASYFYATFFFLSALSFSRTLLVFIVLHGLCCVILSSQMLNKGGKGY